jgi:hypothetical protein
MTEAANHSWQLKFLQIARLTLFEPGPLCEDSPHLAGKSIFDNLESLKPWARKIFEHLEVLLTCRQSRKAQKLDWRKLRTRPKVSYRVETPLCRFLDLNRLFCLLLGIVR